MMISIKRTGGLVGMEEPLGSVDLSSLGEGQAAIARSRAQELLKSAGPASPGADRFEYHVEIQEPGHEPRKIVVYDEGDPEKPEMQALTRLAYALGIAVS